MVKSLGLDENGVKKGAWSKEEDDKLRAYIQRYGHWNWSLLPQFAGLSRSGKSCRLRWMNYLRPNMKHGNFTKEEDDMIVDLHKKLGNKWSMIAAKLPGRSDNEIKNRWNTCLKKRGRGYDDDIVLETEHLNTIEPDRATSKENLDQELQKEGAAILASESSSCSTCTESLSSRSLMINDEYWTETFLQDITSSVDSIVSPLNVDDNSIFQSYGQDIWMNDEFSWSMLDSYIESNTEFINCWDGIQ